MHFKELKLEEWTNGEAGASDEKAVGEAMRSLKRQPIALFIKEIAQGLSKYDWRTSSFPGLSEEERIRKAALRGSGGYRELRQDLLKQLTREGRAVGKAARDVISSLGYEV